jgi:hypothetical protein
MRLKPWVDTWSHHNARYDGEHEALNRGIVVGQERSGTTGRITPLDRRGLLFMVSLISDIASEIATKGITAEAFQERLTAALIRQDPLLPRMTALLVLDGALRDLAGDDHVDAVRDDLDMIAEKLRDWIRAHPAMMELYSQQYIDLLGVQRS